MEAVVLSVIIVCVLCVAGVSLASKEGREDIEKQQAELRRVFEGLFPGAKLTLLPLCRGSFGAIVKCGEVEYLLGGDYLVEEGGDGYMHVRRKERDSEQELFRVSLNGRRTHWQVLTEGFRRLASERAKSA